MSIQKLTIRQFSGGLATISEKKDVRNSAKFTKNLDPFKDPSYITQAKKATKVSGSTVTDLIYWAEDVSPWSTDRYFYSGGGKIYKETNGGTWSLERTVSGGSGEGLKVFDDYLYYALSTELGRYGKLTGAASFDDSFLSDGTFDLDQSGGGTGAADYVPPTSISEAATAKQTFTPTKDPLKAIIIDVDVIGTGDWTITVHDSNDNLIGSKTITNGSMSTGDVTFTFDTPLRVVIGNSYHFHVTSTVANGGVDTGTATDLEDAEFSTLFGILINSTFHPMVVVEDNLIIGNERYLAVWDQSTYNPNLIAFDPGFEVRSIARFEEFIAVATVKGGAIDSGEEARLYFWDAISVGSTVSYNYYNSVTVGMPNAICNVGGNLIGVYGNDGSLYEGADPFNKVVDGVPKLTAGKKIEVYPGAITAHNGRALIGISSSTDDGTGVEQGVYEYGGQHPSLLSPAFNFPYTISTGTTQSTTLQIGMVKSMGSDIYIGWRDDTTYGVDKIAINNGASASGTYETLVFDNKDPNRQLLPFKLTITFEALTTGQSVTPKYKLDRAASFTTGTAADTVGDTKVELPIFTRCKEIEVGFDLASTSNTFIKITGMILEYEDLAGEVQE